MSKVDEYVKAVPDVPRFGQGSFQAEIRRDGGLMIADSGVTFFASKERAKSFAAFLAEWYLEANNAAH